MHPSVFRFAPSPNGLLHLGHAYSALLNQSMARECGGRLLLRIEDIDVARSRPEFETAIYDDLEWLGLEWETPVRRQSEQFADYAAALRRLIDAGLAYPSFMSRAEAQAASPGVDPLGAPLHPLSERSLSPAEIAENLERGVPHAWRLNMDKALAKAGSGLDWLEAGSGTPVRIKADPAAWGDVIIARKETPTSYHLSVTVDDALQGVSHVVRGMDLFHATSIHRLLQRLLGLPQPVWHHHRLISDEQGAKLAKSAGSTSLRRLRETGTTPDAIRKSLGF